MKQLHLLQITLFGFILGFSIPMTAHADLCEKMAVVNMNAASTDQVDNDMVRLSWHVQVQASTANQAMNTVNNILEKSIDNLSKNKEISQLKNNIQTYPQYAKDRSIQTWQGVGSLTFEMPVQALKSHKNLTVAEGLTLTNLEYFPSDLRIEQSREILLQSAIKEFQDKAHVVVKGLGKSGFTVGEISINDESQASPGHHRMYVTASDSMAKGVEVSTAAGSSLIGVSISGRVCLKP